MWTLVTGFFHLACFEGSFKFSIHQYFIPFYYLIILHYIDTPCFVCPSIHRQIFALFPPLAVTSNAALNIQVQVFLWTYLLGEISITSDMQMTPPLWQKVRETQKPLDESERGEWKSWLKAQHSENENHGIRSHHFMGNRWGNSGNSVRLYFSGLQNH